MRPVVSLIITFLAGCTTIPAPTVYRYQDWGYQDLTAIRLGGQNVCSVHRIPFVTRQGFKARLDRNVSPSEEEWQAMQKLPNFVHAGWSLHRTKFYRVPAKVRYCPKCEEESHTIWHLPRT